MIRHSMKSILFIFAGFILFAAAQTCVPIYDSNGSPSSAITNLNVVYSTSNSYTVKFTYYATSNAEIVVNITGCSDDSSLSTAYQQMVGTLNYDSNTATVNLDASATTLYSTSPATRLSGPFTLLLSALFAALFFPKYRMSGILVLCVVGVALCTAQDSDNVVTINVGIPSTITNVCENGDNCFAWPPASVTTGPTSAPNNISGLNPTDGPTNPPSTTGSTDAPTSAPTDAPTIAPTTVPTLPPASLYFNLRVLILSGAIPAGYDVVLGADFSTLAFESVGMPYDYVIITSSDDLSSYLSTTGTGKYSGIVVVNSMEGISPLGSTQSSLITAYQTAYGVKLVIVNDLTGSGLSGISTTGGVDYDSFYDVTFDQSFAQYGKYLNQSARINTNTTINWSDWTDTPCALLSVTITDTTTVTPVLNAIATDGTSTVAAAVFAMTDGTQQLHYFLAQGSDYIHSMAYASVMVNWISPGGIFVGSRRIIFTVQPDDLFLGSYVWNLTTHTNPIGPTDTWYRISADDLQNLADNLQAVSSAAPAGSHVTIEWPTNFGGIKNLYYTRGDPVDYLYNKALEIQDSFYYLSHTWDHPCTLDTDNATYGYTVMLSEVSQNIDYAPGFFGNSMRLWSNTSMITPCVQGLYNSGVLQAMVENGIKACVSDESVKINGTVDYEPLTPYHGVYSSAGSPNGEAGVFFVPRQALDIDYCARTPEDVADEYNTTYDIPRTFEEIMVIDRMYAIEYLIAYRYDPYMLHQTNAATFFYEDPAPDARFSFGAAYNTSLVAHFVQRVVGDVMLYYSLPIITYQMDNLVKKFQQRQTMDACGLTTTVGVTNGQIVDVSVTSQAACQMSLSGGIQLTGDTVEMESVGVETTAWITFDSASTQSWALTTPIDL